MDWFWFLTFWTFFWVVWSAQESPRYPTLQYSRELLLQLRGNYPRTVANWSTDLQGNTRYENWDFNIKARKRGKRGGIRLKLKKLGFKRIPLPSIILANVQSLRRKINELQANVRCLREYRDACMIALTETWLNGKDCDTELSLDGFGAPLRLDRDPPVTGKSQGGGVCLYVNNRWAKTVIVREEMCTADIELLTVSIRPFYLPREFQQLFISVVYIHPNCVHRMLPILLWVILTNVLWREF